jgi:hypothetical protein
MTRLDSLFEVEYGQKLDMNKMVQADRSTGVAFVGRRGNNEGLSGYVKPIPELTPCEAGTISVALGGSYLLSAFVQQHPYYTGQNVAVLTPRSKDMPLNHKIFYSMCIRHNRFRYSAFGREANRTLSAIELPTDVPKWVDEVELPTHDGLARPVKPLAISLDLIAWKEFPIGQLFEVKKGRRLTKASRLPGQTRFIGASEKQNGVTDYNDVQPTFKGEQLTVAYNGNSVGWAFYQDKPFFACDDVNVLEPIVQMSQWSLLFIATIIKHGKSKYTYGYKWTKERMTKTQFLLPCDENEEPDFAFMEAYMKSLPFSAVLAEAEKTNAISEHL